LLLFQTWITHQGTQNSHLQRPVSPAVLPGNSKYIFANRAGIKLAEYTPSQLSNLIVTENSEILDTGTEFEDVLTNVVTGLRDNRTKSYEELSGESD
jgi:hypothetical protein|tara:strand:- start:149 stop:439 length:291 start_codon:yes stop_codon:yes gene_type:complete